MSFLMIIYHTSDAISVQTFALYIRSQFNQQPDWYDSKRCIVLNYVFSFLDLASFLVVHWMFAFDYFRLSYRNRLKSEKKPASSNKCVLVSANFTVSTTTVLIAAAAQLTAYYGTYKQYLILSAIANSFLGLALTFLCFGFWQLIKTAQLSNTQANRGMICVHIVSYLLVILAQYSFYIEYGSVKAYEIS